MLYNNLQWLKYFTLLSTLKWWWILNSLLEVLSVCWPTLQILKSPASRAAYCMCQFLILHTHTHVLFVLFPCRVSPNTLLNFFSFFFFYFAPNTVIENLLLVNVKGKVDIYSHFQVDPILCISFVTFITIIN